MSVSKRASFGLARLTILFLLTIVFVVVYSAYRIMPFYYCYYDLQNHMEAVLKITEFDTAEQIKDKIYKKVKDLGIPAKREEIQVVQGIGDLYTVRLKYQELFYVTFRGKDYDIKVFNFDAYAHQGVRKKKW